MRALPAADGEVAAACRGGLRRHPREGGDDAAPRADGPGQAARDLRGAADPAAAGHRDLEHAQARPRRAHLHLEVPAVGELAHAQVQQRVAPDRAERAHVGVAHAVECLDHPAGEVARGDLVPSHAARLASAAGPRADDEVVAAGADRRDQRPDAPRVVRPVAVHEDEDVVAGRARALGPGQAGAAVAAPGRDHLGAGVPRALGRAVGAAAVGHDHPAHEVARDRAHHLADGVLLVQHGDDDDDHTLLAAAGCPLHAHRLQRMPQPAHAVGGWSESSASRNEP
jgi:hypothetical protein